MFDLEKQFQETYISPHLNEPVIAFWIVKLFEALHHHILEVPMSHGLDLLNERGQSFPKIIQQTSQSHYIVFAAFIL